ALHARGPRPAPGDPRQVSPAGVKTAIVVARSPDRATGPTEGLRKPGRPSVHEVARSGDLATTESVGQAFPPDASAGVRRESLTYEQDAGGGYNKKYSPLPPRGEGKSGVILGAVHG